MKHEPSSSEPTGDVLSNAAFDLHESHVVQGINLSASNKEAAVVMRRISNQKCDEMGWAGYEDALFMLLAYTAGCASMIQRIGETGLAGKLAIQAVKTQVLLQDEASKMEWN